MYDFGPFNKPIGIAYFCQKIQENKKREGYFVQKAGKETRCESLFPKNCKRREEISYKRYFALIKYRISLYITRGR